jgi:hypothetical protein
VSAAIPFADLQESGSSELGGASPQAINVIVDGKGVVSKRPGVGTSSLVTSSLVNAAGIDAIYMSNDGRVFAVATGVGERPIYRITAGSSMALSGGASPGGLRGSSRPLIAETEMLLVLAGGEEIEKVVLDGELSARLGGNPPQSTHVLALANRLLANDVFADKTKVRFSDVALGDTDYSGHEVWSLGGVGTSGYFTAESRPDNVVALAENTGEVFVFGQGTLQTFSPDAVLTFSPVATIEVGCSAPYSIVKVDGEFFWLDHKRRLVKSSGRGYSVISDAIQRTLDGMTTTDDAFGYHVTDGFLDAMVWTFPTDGRTFVWQKDIGWGQWSGWNGNWSRFIVNAACLSPSDGTVLVGTTTGYVGELSLNATTDLGSTIRAQVTTGYLNRDTDAKKHCQCVRFSLRRGSVATTPGPQAYFGWRDRPGAWDARIPIDLGSSGDTEIVVEFRSLGVYRRRQWFFEFSGDSALSLVSADEEFEVLDQ